MIEESQPETASLEQTLNAELIFKHTLLESLRIGVCRVDASGCVRSLNLEGARIFGRTEQDCLGQSLHALIGCRLPDSTTDQDDCPVPHVIKAGKTIWVPKSLIRRRSGETWWVEFQCTQIPDPVNPGALFLFRDLSDQLQLAADEQYLASMPEESPSPIVELDSEAGLVYANPAMIQLLDRFGFRESGVPQILPQDMARLAKDCLKSMTEAKGVPVVVNGIHFEWTFSLIPEKNHLRGYGLDVTKHIQARETLVELQSRFSSLVDSAHEGIISADLNGTIVSWNPAAQSIFGYQLDEVHRQPITMLLDEPFREIYRSGFEKISFYGESHPIETTMELLGLRKNGETFPLELSLTSWKVGLETHYGCILRDITARKQMEQALVIEKERLTKTLQSMAEATITTDTDGRVTLLNPMAETITGWTQQEALNRPLRDVFRPIDSPSPESSERSLENVLASHVLGGSEIPTTLITKSGTQRTITYREAPVRDHRDQLIGTVLVFRDITNQHQQEIERQRIDKLNSLGVLAGGIAHDFNNLLTTILGNLFVAKLRIVPQDPIAQGLNEAEQACLRAKDLTQQLLTFAKGGAPIKKPVVIGDLVRKSTIFALSGSAIGCEFNLPEDLWPLEADEAQLKQVIQNLVINARQAMHEGGVTTISGENFTLSSQVQEENPPLQPGPYIKLSFEDRGPGIAPEHLPNIFDPYFTTKPGATGLGLATAHTIIQRHGGNISVNSQVGSGTTFSVFLPTPLPPSDKQQGILQQLPKGQGRILVMDDEVSIRNMVRDALMQVGYEVTGVRDGSEAISTFSQSRDAGQPFTAILLDLTVPGAMGGKEALRQLRTLDPQIKAIVTSGYSEDPIMANYRAYGFDGILVKPYKITDLYDTLENLFSGKHP